MLYYQNTTNIPNRLVAIIANFVMPDGVDVNEISLRNKQAGRIDGNWGKYYPMDRKVTLNIPQVINGAREFRKYRKEWITLNSRTEFLVMVLAHELRHAWQYQKSGWHLSILKNKWYKEFDAETYESEMLDKWRAFVDEQQQLLIAARNSNMEPK